MSERHLYLLASRQGWWFPLSWGLGSGETGLREGLRDPVDGIMASGTRIREPLCVSVMTKPDVWAREESKRYF